MPCLLAAVTLAWSVPAIAQTEVAGQPTTAPAAPSSADANNPLAKFQAFNVHNYYVPAISELDNQNSNAFWLRYAQPIGKWLFRASLPAARVPTADSKTMSGLGDVNAFAAYLFDTGDPSVSVGVGPQFTLPTASETETGTGKWLGGFAATLFNARSSTLQWGGLVTWQKDFAGDASRNGVNVLAVQPFYFVQLGRGIYLRGSAVAVFDIENKKYHVPVGLGIGTVVPAPGAIFNIFIEPQYTIL
ncbi:MAG: hypothetical protein NTY02_06680, partial [Acidobacteria bacterium]|nr:hypothetical protein [Acidobacteriota bacterium]